MEAVKHCSCCGGNKPITQFHKRRASIDGLNTRCKACMRVALKRCYYKHKEQRIEAMKRYQTNNSDKARRIFDRFRRKNLAYYASRCALYRAQQAQATPRWASLAKIEEFYKEAQALTRQTGIKHEVDHIIPLQSKNVCGLHVEYNLQILTQKANRRKNNKYETQTY